jgi:hypothetical protein
VSIMTEETLSAAALEKGKAAERAAFLDVACAGDAALKRRVEDLLVSQDEAGFLRVPAVRFAAELFGGEGITRLSDTLPTISDKPVRESDRR